MMGCNALKGMVIMKEAVDDMEKYRRRTGNEVAMSAREVC